MICALHSIYAIDVNSIGNGNIDVGDDGKSVTMPSPHDEDYRLSI